MVKLAEYLVAGTAVMRFGVHLGSWRRCSDIWVSMLLEKRIRAMSSMLNWDDSFEILLAALQFCLRLRLLIHVVVWVLEAIADES